MKTTINESDFIKAFQDIRPDNFSYDGLCILFNGLEEFEEDTGEEIELDVIAICCDFVEMTMNEVIENYGWVMDESRLDDDDAYSYVMDWLNNQTWVLGDTKSGTIVFRQF